MYFLRNHIITILLIVGFTIGTKAQVAHYNQYPSLHVSTYIETSTSNMSFAYSMRRLFADYESPLLRLRRSSDNAEEDFYATDTDLINIASINSWAGGSNLYIKIWYDQSGNNRNAIQNNSSYQPRFYPDTTVPYFRGDGSNDYLEVQNGSIQVVTNQGKEGTILFVLRATNRNQNSFGVLSGRNRWSTHTNWGNRNFYFDSGTCCYGNRSFGNSDGVGVFMQYTAIAGSSTVTMRRNAINKKSGSTGTQRCTLTANFGIGATLTNGNSRSGRASDSFFTEMVMYNTDIPQADYETLEQNQMNFWGL